MKTNLRIILGITILVLFGITTWAFQPPWYSNGFIHPLLISKLAIWISLFGGVLTLFDNRKIWPITGFVAIAVAWLGDLAFTLLGH